MANITLATLPTLPVASGLRRAARGALAVLAFALPFELAAPLARVGPLQLSSVELVLYVALALCGASIAIDRLPDLGRLPWRRIGARHAGVLAFVVVLLVSAARAPMNRPDAIKFALRNLGGVALYVAAANLLRAPAAALTTAVALGIGAVVAAALMWAELHVPGVGAALAPFHPGTFDVFGLPRASGPFQYPNIAAMYLEGALPVVLAAGAAADARRGPGARRGAIVATIAALALVEALALTASRAAMLTAAVVVAGVGAHALWRKTSSRWQAPTVLAMLAALAAAHAAFGSLAAVRLKFWNDGVWYRSTITPAEAVPATLAPGEWTTIDVDVRNQGARPWPATGKNRVALTYHWFDASGGQLVVFDGARTPLPHDLFTGDAIRLRAIVHAPDGPGHYRLHLEMVHEWVTWFGEQGDAGYDASVDVRNPRARPAPTAPPLAPTAPTLAPAAPAAAPSLQPGASPPPSTAPEPPLERASRTMLWRAALMAWRDHPLLGLGPDNFRRGYSRYLGLTHADQRLHANNLYFEMLASLGLAGMAALVMIVVGFAGAARAALRQHGPGSTTGLLVVGVAAGLAAYLVHGFLDYFFEFTPTYALFWLLGGLLMGLSNDYVRNPE